MDEEKKTEQPENEEEKVEEKTPFTPASRSKRIAAWIGIILMVFLVIMYSYSIATGAFLNW
ncbi:MAG: hypothetical protein ACI3XJ_01570 [Oscillospiraceae bacterium]